MVIWTHRGDSWPQGTGAEDGEGDTTDRLFGTGSTSEDDVVAKDDVVASMLALATGPTV